MEPLAIGIIGLAGGLGVAAVLLTLNRRSVPRILTGPPTPERYSTDMINMAHIRVAGVGGLSLVAMCALVALYLPVVGISLATGLALGAALAAALIRRRKRAGVPWSSSQRPGANTTLSIDEPGPVTSRPADQRGLRQVAIAAGRG